MAYRYEKALTIRTGMPRNIFVSGDSPASECKRNCGKYRQNDVRRWSAKQTNYIVLNWRIKHRSGRYRISVHH